MIYKLKQIEEKILPDLLNKPQEWKTLLVNYHPPIVERLWAQIGNYRVLLHFIHKCETKDALFHPHPWPSAMHVLNGKYEMGLGFGPGVVEPEKMCTLLLENGGAYYDMTHIDGWHYVRPVEGVCATVMLIGKPWDREQIEVTEKPKPFSEERKLIMLRFFSDYYKNRNHAKRVIENEIIERGDWVEIDGKSLTEMDRRGFGKFIGQKGFVIGRAGGMIDVRFGNERTSILSGHLILLDPSTKPSSKTESEEFKKAKDWSEKEIDDMDPANWEDD